MKKLLFLSTLLLTLMFSCAKEETKPTSANVETTDDSVYFFNANAENPSWGKTVFSDNLNSVATSRSNSAHTHGDFTAGNGLFHFSFSGTENNGGTHGTAVVQFGPAVISMDTECVMVEGNVAVYGGIITEVVGGSSSPFFPYQVGRYFYFRVVDNGQGNNAPTDQYTGVFYTATTSKCGILVPNHPSWLQINFGGGFILDLIPLDVEGASDEIKVN